MHESIVERVRAVAARVAASYGLAIFDVQYRREAVGMVLRVLIDRAGSVDPRESISVDECARVSQDLGAILDVEDVIPTSYTLEVSSPGLDRPLRQVEDYRRFAGRHAKLVMRPPVDGHSFLRGRLEGVDGDAVVVRAEDGTAHRVPMGSITRAHLEVEF
jgi:ribosome maturation factor RimP